MTPESIKALAIELTLRRSVTNSPGEVSFPAFLEERLRGIGGISEVWRVPALDDPHGREIVLALVRGGSGTRTILLTGHYDTVDTANYGPEAEPFACDPERLLPVLLKQLREAKEGPSAARTQALVDLESGEFLPGRGLLDMKGGLAAGISVLQRAGESPLDGNLLFAAVPDEEVASHGMRSLVRQLPAICAEAGNLDIRLAVNLDAEVDSGDGSQGRAIFLGSVGKLLPLVVFLGRPAHAGNPFAGVNPVLAMAEFVKIVESNPDAGDRTGCGNEAPAPPVTLYARDTRTHYDVTMPAAAWCAVNVLTHSLSAAEVLVRFRAYAATACRLAGEAWRERMELSTGEPAHAQSQAIVLTFEELAERCAGGEGSSTAAREPGSVEECAGRILEMAARAGLDGPAAVVAFAPPFYPRAECRDPQILSRVENLCRTFGGGNLVRTRPYFPGISDMSFLDPVPDGSWRSAQANCPVLLAVGDSPSYPAINLGPWGRDYHQKLERLHSNYCFSVLPELLWRLAEDLLTPGDLP